MNNTKTTKRALLSSVMAMLLCITMLIGTTFAWFTDTASTAVNKIQSGTLKVDIVKEDGVTSIKNESMSFVNKDGSANILWEPGATFMTPAFKIKSTGSLALKYKLTLNGITGDNMLLKVIKFSVVKADGTEVDLDTFEGHLTPDAALSDALYIKGHMDEAAGNDYQNKTLEGLGITVYATQDTVENDSFNNQYDKYAQYGERTVKNEAPVVGTNGTYGLVDSGRDNINTKNVTYSIPAGNYDGGFYAQHFGINSTFDGNGSTFKSFQLNCGYVPTTEASTLVVSNLNVNGDLIITASSNNVVIYNCTAKHISVLGVKNDITVTIDGCKITGTPIANVVGNNKYGVYITRPVAEGTAKVSIINSELSNIKGHAIAVNSSGATCDFTITGNKFTNYGLYGEANRAAFKIWGDGVLAPTSNVGGNLNEQATVLANAIKANNTFNAGNNCVVAEFYGATLGLN